MDDDDAENIDVGEACEGAVISKYRQEFHEYIPSKKFVATKRGVGEHSEMENFYIDGLTIKPTNGFRFLGVYLQPGRKFGVEVGEKGKKLRKGAA